MKKRIATVITDMFEDVEYTDPVQSFKEAGHEVITIEKEKGKTVKGKSNDTNVTIDESIDNVNPENFDALFIPGGFSPDMLRGDDRFVTFAKHFMDEKKPVMAICHGPQLLITARSLEGRGATGYKSIQVDMEYAGAKVKDEEVVVCQNQLVTSRQPDDIPAFNRESLKVLEG
ncbi:MULTISPECIES: type 1 glutamine amidotransferase domain-containing protein [unclassified Oceanobacillus]|uniref:type 1 glutamine amidotransferase domain-containing protein n=1 Tax=unclassified Oceanobacillus TaxID=2630292 RepID=UPI001BE64F44|nr:MULTISPECIES: type 1 glutamine amidotransferase domain-containing protein [unclassified Oceanobacillus]MBT2599876.1 type 1 glutamine amidotransferase [Oceanobacillus sp. ISL-74]MBT2652674.1 type 1 glutamine amidotransferase [Oceanobacillus sp. ISL-73]